MQISTNFMHLQSKLTSEMCSKIGGLDEKKGAKPSQSAHFATFFWKKPIVFIEKWKILIDFPL